MKSASIVNEWRKKTLYEMYASGKSTQLNDCCAEADGDVFFSLLFDLWIGSQDSFGSQLPSDCVRALRIQSFFTVHKI